MNINRYWCWCIPALLLLALCGACRNSDSREAASSSSSARPPVLAESKPQSASKLHKNIGFKSRRNLDDHFEKHGAEFDGLTREQYLAAAQELRDAPVGGDILEARRPDGTVSRFDRTAGAFLAFDSDLTIRTFFKPNDGERYFKRQINREH